MYHDDIRFRWIYRLQEVIRRFSWIEIIIALSPARNRQQEYPRNRVKLRHKSRIIKDIR